jgi:hypothetical protein
MTHPRALGLATTLLASATFITLLAARPLPGAAQQPEPTPTARIVTEPTAAPVPAYLPRILRNVDSRTPDAVVTRLEGYLVKLTAVGRAACAPGTHILQKKPEGFPNAAGIAALYSPHREPEYNLDLFTGDYVEVFGFAGLAPDDCRSLTWQLLTVESIRRIIVPPGGPT